MKKKKQIRNSKKHTSKKIKRKSGAEEVFFSMEKLNWVFRDGRLFKVNVLRSYIVNMLHNSAFSTVNVDFFSSFQFSYTLRLLRALFFYRSIFISNFVFNKCSINASKLCYFYWCTLSAWFTSWWCWYFYCCHCQCMLIRKA